MKKNIIVIVVNIILLNINLIAQWQPDVQLTAIGALTSPNNAWCIAANGNIVHVVWYGGYPNIYYKHSTDAGINWTGETIIANGYYNAYQNPSIAVSGSYVHVIFNRLHVPAGAWGISYNVSTDAGLSWRGELYLTPSSGYPPAYSPSMSVSGSVLHVVWQKAPYGAFPQIGYAHSTDAGNSWAVFTTLTNSTFGAATPSVSSSGSVVHVVWDDTRNGFPEIFYKRSTDTGSSWSADTGLTNYPPSLPEIPSIASSGSIVHVVWDDHRGGINEIYYKRSTDGGVSWGADTRLTLNTVNALGPSIAVSGSNLHIVWYDSRDGNYEIYYKNSTDAGNSWGADTRLTFNDSTSKLPSIAVSGSAVHVLWSDSRTGNFNVFYKRNPTGNPTGIVNINSEIPKAFNLFQNYPNPFNPTTKIKFSIPSPSPSERVGVRLVIYDILGREIVTLVNEQLKPGSYEVEWDATNYPSGVYFYKLIAGGFVEARKMILLK